MKKVITYGTFDLLHFGHIKLLERAKTLGDHLIVGVTSDSFDKNRGKLNVKNSLLERIELVKSTGLADEIIVEEYEGQKIDDILKYCVDIFAIGSDWLGKFDYLKEYCHVVYLERTKGISSTQLRDANVDIISLGVIGTGRIANRFIPESKYVSGVDVKAVYNPDIESAKQFCEKHELVFFSNDFEEFIEQVDGVYIASPHATHADYIRKALERGKHVLCENPITLSVKELNEFEILSKKRKLTLMEGIKTAYCPGFQRLLSVVKSGSIGLVKDVEASFSKLVSGNVRELDPMQDGGSMTELGSYVLLPILKILGLNYEQIHLYSYKENGIDLFTKGVVVYPNATSSFKVGLGVKTEGELVISGTKGYAYVPAPWWKTEYFELRFEDTNKNMKYFYKFEGDGLRYELFEFVNRINGKNITHALPFELSKKIVSVIEDYSNGENVMQIK